MISEVDSPFQFHEIRIFRNDLDGVVDHIQRLVALFLLHVIVRHCNIGGRIFGFQRLAVIAEGFTVTPLGFVICCQSHERLEILRILLQDILVFGQSLLLIPRGGIVDCRIEIRVKERGINLLGLLQISQSLGILLLHEHDGGNIIVQRCIGLALGNPFL